jgi:hypothetical protein
MTFGGTFGAGGNMIPIAGMVSPIGDLTYNPDAISVDLSLFGNTQVIPAPRIDNITIFAELAATPLLGIFNVGGGADTGSLSTSAPAGGDHGIPANFGPGRGNWTFNNVLRLRATIPQYTTGALLNSEIGQAVVEGMGLIGGGDIVIIFRNIALAEPIRMVIELEYRHSIGIG